jgi:4-pyridoxolactonase
LACGPTAEIYTPTFQIIAGDQEIAKGVRLFETPGHAALA